MPEAARETGVPEEHWKALQFIEEVTENTASVQKRVLEEILTQNASAEYLHRHGLLAPNMNAFKKLMPIVSYEDIQPDILRIAHGDTSPILSGRPISEFLTSSGTSGGERKLMPTIADELDRRSHLYSLLMPVMNQSVPGLNKGKGMYLLFIKSESKTPSGLVARPVLTSYYKSRHFRNRPLDPYNVYTSPNETILCPDSYQSMYAQLLCGLIQRSEVLRVGAVFASGFIRAISFLEKNWPSLCHDIRSGVMDESISDKPVREAVSQILRPNPDLARVIESECGKVSWQGIIKRLWPNTKYIDVIVTGTMAQYIPILEFYGGGLPLTCTMYASSECYFGLNLNPMCKPSEVTYTLIPTMCYFEFLPVKKGVNNGNVEFDHSDLVDLVDVKLGQEYELVVTTYAGLYRYQVGDVLRVAGFHNKAPNFKFIHRKNVALCIDADKTNESELHNAVTHAVQNLLPFGSSLTEYTSYADTTSIPGHYVLFWELQTNKEATPVPPSVFEDCCLAVEECLNSVYRQGRASDKSIGPLEIRIVEDGTFDKLMDYAISQGASINQYKAPRCVRDGPIVMLLNSRVQSKFCSPKCPKWIPGHKKWNKENEGA